MTVKRSLFKNVPFLQLSLMFFMFTKNYRNFLFIIIIVVLKDFLSVRSYENLAETILYISNTTEYHDQCVNLWVYKSFFGIIIFGLFPRTILF